MHKVLQVMDVELLKVAPHVNYDAVLGALVLPRSWVRSDCLLHWELFVCINSDQAQDEIDLICSLKFGVALCQALENP